MEEAPFPRVPELPAARDESQRIAAWRLEEMLRLGFAYEDADAFANSDGDLHQLEELLRKGCSPMTALRIAS